MFLSFHHHPPERARAILRRTRSKKRIALPCWSLSARKPSMLLSCIQVPLAVFFLTPLIRPLKASQLLFTLRAALRAASVRLWELAAVGP